MNYNEIALNLINEWQAGNYLNQTQKKANLQCRIAEALENGVALSCKSESAGWVCECGTTHQTGSHCAICGNYYCDSQNKPND